MAGVRFSFTSGESVTGSGSITKTLLLITAASHRRVHIHNIRVSYKGVTSSHVPHRLRVTRVSDGGTPEETARTAVKLNAGDSETVGATAYGKQASGAWTDEPAVTADSVLWEDLVSPNNGFTEFTSAGIGPLILRGGESIAIQVVNPTDSNTCAVEVFCEE